MNKFLRLLILGIGLIGLVFIRFRESELFYDPLLHFFKSNYNGKALPEMDQAKFFLHLFLRYGINTLFSLIILWSLFKEKEMLRLAAGIYLLLFVILGGVIYVMLQTDQSSHLPLFYVRRFLIQPLLLFILVPAFYYYHKINKT